MSIAFRNERAVQSGFDLMILSVNSRLAAFPPNNVNSSTLSWSPPIKHAGTQAAWGLRPAIVVDFPEHIVNTFVAYHSKPVTKCPVDDVRELLELFVHMGAADLWVARVVESLWTDHVRITTFRQLDVVRSWLDVVAPDVLARTKLPQLWGACLDNMVAQNPKNADSVHCFRL